MAYQYQEQLPRDALNRYQDKLSSVGMKICPYKVLADRWVNNPTEWPRVEYPDIYHYLIDSPGVYTSEKMKNYKSLDGYRYLISGWVQSVYHIKTASAIIFKTEVRPSQRLNDDSHHPWAALTTTGTVVTAHCDCKAGLGESCSHVAALLFKLEAAVRFGHTTVACTDLPCAWNSCSVDSVKPAPVAKIQFYEEKACDRLKQSKRPRKMPPIPSTSDDQQQFLQALCVTNTNSVALSTFANFNASFVQTKSSAPRVSMPPPLRDLFNPNDSTVDCEAILGKIAVTDEQISFVNDATRAQSFSTHWLQQRLGRITASVAHNCLHTQTDRPAPSLVKKICVPSGPLHVPAVSWGRNHEEDAFQLYSHLYAGSDISSGPMPAGDILCSHIGPHINLKIDKCGLVICKKFPFLGASPDAVMSCDCCGRGVLEIKCPFKYRETPFSEAVLQKDFPLNAELDLKPNHPFYTQVQVQMFVCNAKYSDLMIWTVKDCAVVRVTKDMAFLDSAINKLTKIWRNAILTELVTRSLEHEAPGDKENKKPVSEAKTILTEYCLCRTTTDLDNMVGCDRCDQWFHPKCLKLKRLPTSKVWYCPSCRNVKRKRY